MWWTLPVIVGAILLGICILLCGIVCCVQRCFHPEDARESLVRTIGDGNEDRYIGPGSMFSRKSETAPSPRVV